MPFTSTTWKGTLPNIAQASAAAACSWMTSNSSLSHSPKQCPVVRAQQEVQQLADGPADG
jgi:hypothetical protein